MDAFFSLISQDRTIIFNSNLEDEIYVVTENNFFNVKATNDGDANFVNSVINNLNYSSNVEFLEIDEISDILNCIIPRSVKALILPSDIKNMYSRSFFNFDSSNIEVLGFNYISSIDNVLKISSYFKNLRYIVYNYTHNIDIAQFSQFLAQQGIVLKKESEIERNIKPKNKYSLNVDNNTFLKINPVISYKSKRMSDDYDMGYKRRRLE